MTGRSRTRRYLLTQQGYYPGVVAKNYDVYDWSTLNEGTLFQDSAKTTPATANGDVVGCWVDRVKLTEATQVTTAVKPTLATNSLNGLPTLAFDGGDLLSTANISISTFAVWVVFRDTANNSIVYEQSPDAINQSGLFLYNNASSFAEIIARKTLLSRKTSTVTTGVNYILSRHEYNGTHATHNLYFNNALKSMTNTTTNDPGAADVIKELYIGARNGGIVTLTGNIAHLFIVSPYPTADIRANVETYINNIWSVY